MQTAAGEHVRAQFGDERLEQRTRLADPIGHGRTGEIDAFPCINLRLPIERKMIATRFRTASWAFSFSIKVSRERSLWL